MLSSRNMIRKLAKTARVNFLRTLEMKVLERSGEHLLQKDDGVSEQQASWHFDLLSSQPSLSSSAVTLKSRSCTRAPWQPLEGADCCLSKLPSPTD